MKGKEKEKRNSNRKPEHNNMVQLGIQTFYWSVSRVPFQGADSDLHSMIQLFDHDHEERVWDSTGISGNVQTIGEHMSCELSQ